MNILKFFNLSDAYLKNRFIKLWKRLGATTPPLYVYSSLADSYNEPHRLYHTLEHVKTCLKELDQVQHLVINAEALELATWFHDVIYFPENNDNEAKSATFALEKMAEAGLAKELQTAVEKLILATSHAPLPAYPDAGLITDIDLAIFGQSEEVFDQYDDQIRQEYNFVPFKDFLYGRLTLLQLFLKQPKIYQTKYFFDKYEEQARLNIKRTTLNLQVQIDILSIFK